jgi:integrase
VDGGAQISRRASQGCPGEGYFNEDSGQALGWDSMWQRFMTRLLKDTDVKERFTEHDLRGKVGSDVASVERAADLLGHASKEITKPHYRRKPEVIKPAR